MNNQTEIKNYYNDLAASFDENKFENTYGSYIHKQEEKLIKKYICSKDIAENLDIACGTGRFLDYAYTGVDISENMLEIAKKKYADRNLLVAGAENLPFDNQSFQNIISFHLFMHLDLILINSILNEVARVAKDDAIFVFDIPSAKRRKLTKYKADNWHSANQISKNNLKYIIKDNWTIEKYYGISFFPINRIPNKMRKSFMRLDNILCKSFLKEYSSNLVFVLKKI